MKSVAEIKKEAEENHPEEELNEEENLDIAFPDSYIEDLAEHYISRDLTDDELRELIDTALAKRLPYYRKARYVISGNELEDRGQIKRTVESFKKLLGI